MVVLSVMCVLQFKDPEFNENANATRRPSASAKSPTPAPAYAYGILRTLPDDTSFVGVRRRGRTGRKVELR